MINYSIIFAGLNKLYNKYHRVWINATTVNDEGEEKDIKAYTFILSDDSWKGGPSQGYVNEIKKNIEKLFKVNVIKVNIINQKPKSKMRQGKKSTKKGYIWTFSPLNKLNFFFIPPLPE